MRQLYTKVLFLQMLMTATSRTEFNDFSCLSFNKLNEDFNGKVHKISSMHLN